MRSFKLLPLALLFVAPLPAQQAFEGIISMNASGNGQTMAMKVHVKDTRQAIVTAMPNGGEMRMVIEAAANRITMLIPMPPGAPGGRKGMKSVMDLGSMPESDAPPPDVAVRHLGTNQTIAGMRCDDYEVISQGKTTNMCATATLGRYAIPSMGGRPGSAQMPAWAKAFGNRPMFPLKVWDDKGTVVMEVTSVERTRVAESFFDTDPEGYMTMPGFGGGQRN